MRITPWIAVSWVRPGAGAADKAGHAVKAYLEHRGF